MTLKGQLTLLEVLVSVFLSPSVYSYICLLFLEQSVSFFMFQSPLCFRSTFDDFSQSLSLFPLTILGVYPVVKTAWIVGCIPPPSLPLPNHSRASAPLQNPPNLWAECHELTFSSFLQDFLYRDKTHYHLPVMRQDSPVDKECPHDIMNSISYILIIKRNVIFWFFYRPSLTATKGLLGMFCALFFKFSYSNSAISHQKLAKTYSKDKGTPILNIFNLKR